MNKEELSEFLHYFYKGEKVRCTFMIKRIYGMSLEEAKEWCGKNFFNEVEDIQGMKDKLSRSKRWQ